jgi:hypothetical protein
MDQRRDQLAHWAADIIRQQYQHSVTPELDTVSGDASFRRYFRLNFCQDQQYSSWIAVDAPADKEDNPRFVRIARHWHQHDIAVPEVIAHNFDQGFMLLQDFGDDMLWPALHQQGSSTEHIQQLYRQAIDQLITIQQLPTTDLPSYDGALLDQEMALFSDWLCVKELKLELSNAEQAMLQQVFAQLREQALEQPAVVVHRDFHSRNLMLKNDGSLGVIDFQDAVVGAASYDLVSLLRDCYVRWDESLITPLLEYYWQQASIEGICQQSLDAFIRDFDWMGMQRHLKAAGIFARLHLRDGKDGYLADIPNTCRYLLDISARYPQFSDFHHWLRQRFLPALQQFIDGRAV